MLNISHHYAHGPYTQYLACSSSYLTGPYLCQMPWQCSVYNNFTTLRPSAPRALPFPHNVPQCPGRQHSARGHRSLAPQKGLREKTLGPSNTRSKGLADHWQSPRCPHRARIPGLLSMAKEIWYVSNDCRREIACNNNRVGDLIQMTILGQPTIIINSPKLAVDMLNKKSAIYSSRPHLTMACDLVGWRDILVLLKYTDKFKACRRMLHAVIGTRASVDSFQNTLEEE